MCFVTWIPTFRIEFKTSQMVTRAKILISSHAGEILLRMKLEISCKILLAWRKNVLSVSLILQWSRTSESVYHQQSITYYTINYQPSTIPSWIQGVQKIFSPYQSSRSSRRFNDNTSYLLYILDRYGLVPMVYNIHSWLKFPSPAQSKLKSRKTEGRVEDPAASNLRSACDWRVLWQSMGRISEVMLLQFLMPVTCCWSTWHEPKLSLSPWSNLNGFFSQE